jgi:hypothetical protein
LFVLTLLFQVSSSRFHAEKAANSLLGPSQQQSQSDLASSPLLDANTDRDGWKVSQEVSQTAPIFGGGRVSDSNRQKLR